jgi:hypothetical protein
VRVLHPALLGSSSAASAIFHYLEDDSLTADGS